jgi:hypothetical protein
MKQRSDKHNERKRQIRPAQKQQKQNRSMGQLSIDDTKIIEKTVEQVDNIISNSQKSETLSNAIFLAIELESNFKLYSYRVISPQNFVERSKELIQMFKL